MTEVSRSVRYVESHQVSWWATHVFIEAMVRNFAHLPAAGTPSWCALADGDPRKLLALAVDGEHHVLRKETAQEAMVEAGRDIRGAADWSAAHRYVATHKDFYAARPWLRRVTE